MKRSLQEIIELVIFGLIALVAATLLLWLGGWLLGGVGVVLKFLAGLLWSLLRFVLPIAIIAGVVFFLVRLVAKPRNKPVAASATADGGAAGAAGASLSDAAESAGEKVSDAADAVTAKVAEVKESVTGETKSAEEKLEANRDKDKANEPETRADDAEPVDVNVDTSGYKEMDDLAEDLEDESDDKKG